MTKIRVNINLRFDSDFEKFAMVFNNWLVKEYCSLIDFRNCDPHLTLTMGSVSFDNLPTLARLVGSFVSHLHPPPRFCLENPRRERLTGKYIMVDPEDDDEIAEIKHLLWEHVFDQIIPSKFGGPDNPPHITLGLVKRKFPTQIALRSHSYKKPVSVVAVRISETGMNGTCIGTLHEFPVK
jgi:hypothetical protein